MNPNYNAQRMLAAAGVVIFFIIVLRLGWLCDDAFISFRAVDNLISGYGLVSNPGERVQAFTSPLWTLLIAALYSVFRDIYGVAMVACLLCSLGAALVIALRRDAGLAPAAALLLLMVSYSFTSYSTGGLENPLAHLLLSAFCAQRLSSRRKPAWSWFLLAGLVALNRLDHVLIVLPSLVRDFRRAGPRRTAGSLLVGFSPLLIWLVFATLFYGFPFPNTAYAKLNLGIGRSELLAQGLAYFLDSVLRDPIMLTVIVLAPVLVICDKERSGSAIPLLMGAWLYLTYILYIGGDFMAGRFLTAPYLVSVIVIADSLGRLEVMVSAVVCSVALLCGLSILGARPVDTRTECFVPLSGIVDERACYVEYTGVAQNVRLKKYETHEYYREGLEYGKKGGVIVSMLVGMAGYAAGRGVHIVDEYGLTDPLLARIKLPAEADWRIGHFRRAIPKGYLETLQSGKNHIKDSCIRDLWDNVKIATRGPIFSGKRLRALLRLNLVGGTCAAEIGPK